MSQYKVILYADDDMDDKAWVSEACKAVNAAWAIEFVENGRQALDYLYKLPLSDLPALIVLDLNMPQLDGRQTLQKIKADPEYQQIPVAIVTTSSNNIDKAICQRLGASIFLIKPDTHAGWQNIIHKLKPFIYQDLS